MIHHTKSSRCPVCAGAQTDPQGKGIRCWGFTSDDGKYVRCTRENFAGSLQADGSFFIHFMAGDCKCGGKHGEAPHNGSSKIVLATYEYKDESSKTLYHVLRYLPKGFKQERWDEKAAAYVGGEGCMTGVRRVLYRLPEILASTGPVLIVEGEKDADTGWWLGLPATCNVGGAGKWHLSYNAALKDRDIIIIPDTDDAGRKHAAEVSAHLKGHVKSIKMLELPEKDLTLWVEAGGTAEELTRLINEPLDYIQLTGSKPQLAEQYLPEIEDTVDYILEPVAIAGGLTQLHGEPKSGKSCLSLYLSIVAAIGGEVPGEFIIAANAVPVLYLAFEDGPRRLKRRILDYMAGLGMPDCYPPNFRLWIKPDLDIATPQGQMVLMEAIKESKSRLVVLDTLSHVHRAEENSSGEMKMVMAALTKIARETNCCILYVHHSNKGSGDNAKSAIYKGRGSSAIVAAADVVLDWARPANNITKCEFISKDDDGQAWNFHYQTLTDGISWKMSIQDKESIAPTDFKILQGLRNICVEFPDGVVAKQLGEFIGISKKTAQTGLGRLEKKGDAIYKDGPNNSKIYRPSGV